MPAPRRPARTRSLPLPTSYAPLLADLKARVRTAQVQAGLAANRALIALYWEIGHTILRAQAREGWGAKVIERLARDLQAEFPEMSGLSRTNLLFMRAFAETWAVDTKVLQAVRQLEEPAGREAEPIVSPAATEWPAKVLQPVRQLVGGPPEPLASLPWGHNLLLLHKLKTNADRLWYARAALAHGWSRSVLALQIERKAHKRVGKAPNNFAQTLPPAQSELAQQTLKDPYVFDFLTLGEAARERDIETGLVEHVTKLLLELGAGFAFVGRQVPLEVAGKDYFLDLLFYHTRLHCYVVVELKAGEFQPEFAGKLNFYLSAVDELIRQPEDKPTIGLLLCRTKEKVEVEYALRDVKKPIGVAQWKTKLVDALPKSLRGALPTVAQLERELTKEVK